MLDVSLIVERPGFRLEVAFAVAGGECLGLFGPSGAGKSTVLETIAGLRPPVAGDLRLGPRQLAGLPAAERRVGLLRQDPALFPHLSVGANLAYAPRSRPSGAVPELARRLGIEGLLGERPHRLSGGQRQRVALGRLLLSDPQALLLDEPFEGLDGPLRRDLWDLVRAEVADRQLPAVLVSHDLAEVQACCQRIAVLDAGRLLQVGRADEIVLRPASIRAAQLLGYRSFIAGARPGALFGVHPGRVRAGRHEGLGVVVTGVVRDGHPAGAGWIAEIELVEPVSGRPGSPCRAVLSAELQEAPPPPGGLLEVTVIDPPVFGEDGRLVGLPLDGGRDGHRDGRIAPGRRPPAAVREAAR